MQYFVRTACYESLNWIWISSYLTSLDFVWIFFLYSLNFRCNYHTTKQFIHLFSIFLFVEVKTWPAYFDILYSQWILQGGLLLILHVKGDVFWRKIQSTIYKLENGQFSYSISVYLMVNTNQKCQIYGPFMISRSQRNNLLMVRTSPAPLN